MLNPDSGTGDYTLEVIADKPETARIQIYNIYSNLVYENTIVVAEGLNRIAISPHFLNNNGLYLINYIHDNNTIERTKFIK